MTVNSRTAQARSRGRVLALSAATATVLAATALALPAYAATGATPQTATAHKKAAAPITLTDGTLDWGIKKSFRDYLTGPIAGGKITVADGAKTNEDGSFQFTDGKGTYDLDTHAVSTAFQGSVHLYGHHGAIDIKLSDFKLTTEGTKGALSADVETGTGEAKGAKAPQAKEVKQDVELAALDLTDVTPGNGEDGDMTFADIPATLTADGASTFEGYYQEGEKLDAATLKVRTENGGSGDNGGSEGTGTSGGSGSTGGSGDGGTDGGGKGGTSTGGESGTEKPAAGTIVDGNLDWGVKESFRKYVTGPIANGKVDLSDGAKSTSDGYRFPKASGDADSGALNASFEGGVRFLGHKEGDSYSLDLTFSKLRVKAEGTKGTLVSDVRSKDRESGEVTTHKALAVANLKLEAGALDPVKDVITVKKAPATLTAKGAEAFGGFYQEGEKLDPVTAAVSLDENASLPGADPGDDGDGGAGGNGPSANTVGGGGDVGGTGGNGRLASTGAGLPSGSLLGGAALLAALGGGAVYAAQRRNRGTAEER
ncbi:HtaA domain-containing protein [Streptomyces sp. NPDC005438]|uniref:HtaA domain-containing protein n=1 Tax=Streptomyces sp. NPDC005438 TaxID=3156880 RepID=UPI0033B3E384